MWLAEALLASAIGLLACSWKANRRGLPLFSGPARKVALGLAPPLVAGTFLTFLLFRAGLPSAMTFSTFPSVQPVTPQNMNYAVVVMGSWLAIGTVYFFASGRKKYVGPVLLIFEV